MIKLKKIIITEAMDSPDVNSKEWKDLRTRIMHQQTEFLKIKEELLTLYKTKVRMKKFMDLAGKRQPKIIKKLFTYKGDITPPMLVSLVKDVESLK